MTAHTYPATETKLVEEAITRLRQQLNDQEWNCSYCGKRIVPGEEIALGYGEILIHLPCASLGPAPSVRPP